MRKLHLHIGEELQDEFSLQKLNLLLLFQVNCPGCFLYALPAFNALHQRFEKDLGFLALSTAFEDFDKNTREHTELLLHKGEPIGETKKALSQQGITKLPYGFDFPVGMDQLLSSGQKQEVVENICNLNPNFQIWSAFDQNLLREKVSTYLGHQHAVSLTFTSNQFKGTPTLVLFNDRYELLQSWFGHQPVQEIVSAIESMLNLHSQQ